MEGDREFGGDAGWGEERAEMQGQRGGGRRLR